jgi:hypothetical protein
LAEHWDLPNTGVFYSKDVASVHTMDQFLTTWVAETVHLINFDSKHIPYINYIYWLLQKEDIIENIYAQPLEG